MTTIIPLRGRIAVRPDDAEKVTAGGIILPDGKEKEVTTGVVVARAAGITAVEVGDKVLYIKFAGEKTAVEGLVILDFESEVLGIIEKEGD